MLKYLFQVVEDDQNLPFWEEDGDVVDAFDPAQYLKAEMVENHEEPC